MKMMKKCSTFHKDSVSSKKVEFMINLPSVIELFETADFCVQLYRNLAQASNFGSSFDQFSFEFFYENFHRRCLFASSVPWCKKIKKDQNSNQRGLAIRGAWSDRNTNDIFAQCPLIFYFVDFKFSNFVCPSELHPLIWFLCKNSFRKEKNFRKTTQNALAPSIFILCQSC